MTADPRAGGDDDRLRLAFASLAELDEPTTACPSLDQIWDAARGEAPPADTARIVDHLVGCGACAEAWRLAIELPSGERGRDVASATAEPTSPPTPQPVERGGSGPSPDDRGDVLPLRSQAGTARRARWLRYGGAVTALAMAAAIVLLIRPRGGKRAVVEAHLDEPRVLRAGAPHRADSHAVGDVLRLQATAPASAHAELRVYRDGHDLVLRCPDPAGASDGCVRAGDRLTVDLVLPRIGTYRAVLVSSPRPLPAPTGSLDADSTGAAATGADVQPSSEIPVL